MLTSFVRSCFLPWQVPDARIWVLAVVLAGMLASSVGMVNSHGIAALASAQHGNQLAAGHAHAHHATGDTAALETSLWHAHHAADHSHDNAHMPPLTLGSVAPLPPDWRLFAPSRMKGLLAYRLERPPMA